MLPFCELLFLLMYSACSEILLSLTHRHKMHIQSACLQDTADNRRLLDYKGACLGVLRIVWLCVYVFEVSFRGG